MSLPQPYRTDYTGPDPQLAMLFQNIDEMLDILFNAAGTSTSSGTTQTFTAGNGITIVVSGSTVTISLTNPQITLAQVAARVAAGV